MYPTGPKNDKGQYRMPQAKLTGANNIAVPPSKGWTVNPLKRDDPPIVRAPDHRDTPPERHEPRWDGPREGILDGRLEAPVIHSELM